MDRYEMVAFAACGLSLASMAYYVWTIVSGETRPSRSSYWIWSGLGVLIAASYVASGAANWYLCAANTIGTLVIAAFSLFYGEGTRLNAWDRCCVALACASVPLWIVLRFVLSGEQAAISAFAVQMFADAIGCVPVFEKAWNRPENESRRSWLVSVVVYAVNLFAVRTWTVQDVVWNGWLGGACVAITVMLFLRPRSVASVSEA